MYLGILRGGEEFAEPGPQQDKDARFRCSSNVQYGTDRERQQRSHCRMRVSIPRSSEPGEVETHSH
jgi:predicted fused transcriptional regulator/phosphomethylpyrimidine kinase